MLSSNPQEEFQRAQDIRNAAQQAHMKLHAVRVVQDSVHARSRTTQRATIPVGSTVFVWRKSPLGRASLSRWVGPGVLIMNNASNSTCWVSLRGILFKCSLEQVRLAHSEESMGTELVRSILGEHKSALEVKAQRGFRDITGEEVPPPDQQGNQWSPSSESLQQL